MDYGQELIQLIPLLKSLIKRLQKQNACVIDEDEAIGKCLEEVAKKNPPASMENVSGYMFGICKNALRTYNRSVMRYQKRITSTSRDDIALTKQFNDTVGSMTIDIDSYVEFCGGDHIKVWESLKTNRGDVKLVSKELGMHNRKVRRIRADIREAYEKLISV